MTKQAENSVQSELEAAPVIGTSDNTVDVQGLRRVPEITVFCPIHGKTQILFIYFAGIQLECNCGWKHVHGKGFIHDPD